MESSEIEAIERLQADIKHSKESLLVYKNPNGSLLIPEEFKEDICKIICEKYKDKLDTLEKEYVEYFLNLI